MLVQIKNNLLENYQKYNYLNANNKEPLVKIFVSYIKPSFLFKSEILTPVHLGRSIAQTTSKDGIISDSDLQWLYKNCIGDNDFEDNISSTNRQIGFFTGTYRAWKNYDDLGNPAYFGSFGYRRLLNPIFLENLEDYDIIIPKAIKNTTLTNKELLISAHGRKIYDLTLMAINALYPEQYNIFNEYMQLKYGYYFEIYIMKKFLFFDFCSWLYPIINKLLENSDKIICDLNEKREILDYFKNSSQEHLCNESNFELYQKRSIAFAIERLTGFYLYSITKSGKYNFKEIDTIYFEDNLKVLTNNLRKRLK